jgi:hypothetical protein
MISTTLHWIPTRTSGRLAISARPRGGDWLESELFAWKSLGIDILVPLLEPDEQSELDLTNEAAFARLYGIGFVSFPIPDRGTPPASSSPSALLERLRDQLQSGKSIAIHCRQGVGRAGMTAASLLTLSGLDPDAAVSAVSAARGVPVPETTQQRDWISSVLAHRG